MQALLLPLLVSSGPEGQRSRRAALVDDTPILLRWSRAAQQSSAVSGRQAIPLEGLMPLPPPPPASLVDPMLDVTPAGGAGSRASGRPTDRPSQVLDASLLPRQPAEAFALVRKVALDDRPQQPSPQLVALQRRQWWLLPEQSQALQELWERGQQRRWPASLSPLPEGIRARSITASAAAPLQLSELHGRSLLDGDQLWLFWRQGASLWLLNASLPQAPTADPALSTPRQP